MDNPVALLDGIVSRKNVFRVVALDLFQRMVFSPSSFSREFMMVMAT